MHVEVFSLISDKIVAYSFTFDLPGKWLIGGGVCVAILVRVIRSRRCK